MKYRPTPFNIVSAGLIILSIWSAINPGPEGWGSLLLFYLLPLGLFVLFIDFIIQHWLTAKYKQTFIIETSVLLFFVLGYSWTQKTKTLIIPDKLTSSYIVTIYDVDNAPKLPISILTWNYEVKIPDNGILLTSTSFDNEFPETQMKTYSGKELNTDKTDLGFVRLMENEIDCNGKKYKYRSWMVDSVSCCTYSTNDLHTLKMQIEKYYCGQKPSL